MASATNQSIRTIYFLEKVGSKLSELELCFLWQLFQLPHLTKLLEQYPILFLVDDTLQPKLGKKFKHVKILHNHACHLDKGLINAHDFVTLAVAFFLCVILMNHSRSITSWAYSLTKCISIEEPPSLNGSWVRWKSP